MIRTVLKDPKYEVPEQTSSSLTFLVTDEKGGGLPGGSLSTLKLTLYDVLTGNVINSATDRNVLGANGGTVDGVGNADIGLAVADNPMIGTLIKEWHLALFKWTWSGGTKGGAHEVVFPVKNLTKVP